MMTAQETLAQLHEAWVQGAYDGTRSPDDFIREYENCRSAFLEPDGRVWIEGPQRGHYLEEDRLEELVLWLKDRRVM